MRRTTCSLIILTVLRLSQGKLEEDEGTGESDFIDSTEAIGPTVTQIYKHPYAASLQNNNTYACSAVILNTYWLVTLSKCFEGNVVTSYVTHKNLSNFAIRTGSSYNSKGGSLSKIKMLINNFDLKVSAVKLATPLVFDARVQAVRLPNTDEEPTLGFLVSMLAWTPDGHIRLVNVPVLDPAICEDVTKLIPGHYICVGGVQDPNRHFCRQDNGGAVIQNDTLVGISFFLHTCALYTKTHAFPKVSSFTRWLDSVIWDENNRPTTTEPPTTTTTTKKPTTLPEADTSSTTLEPYYEEPNLITLPFDPINVPLEPGEDNSVIPRMSMYESRLRKLARQRTSTTVDPRRVHAQRAALLRKYGKAVMMMPGLNRRNEYQYN